MLDDGEQDGYVSAPAYIKFLQIYAMVLNSSTLTDYLKRCHGQTGLQTLLLSTYAYDTCGSDRKATQVCLLFALTKESNPSFVVLLPLQFCFAVSISIVHGS